MLHTTFEGISSTPLLKSDGFCLDGSTFPRQDSCVSFFRAPPPQKKGGRCSCGFPSKPLETGAALPPTNVANVGGPEDDFLLGEPCVSRYQLKKKPNHPIRSVEPSKIKSQTSHWPSRRCITSRSAIGLRILFRPPLV